MERSATSCEELRPQGTLISCLQGFNRLNKSQGTRYACSASRLKSSNGGASPATIGQSKPFCSLVGHTVVFCHWYISRTNHRTLIHSRIHISRTTRFSPPLLYHSARRAYTISPSATSAAFVGVTGRRSCTCSTVAQRERSRSCSRKGGASTRSPSSIRGKGGGGSSFFAKTKCGSASEGKLKPVSVQ